MKECPACIYAITEENNQGYCPNCGWEFVTYLAPYEPGEKMLRERLMVTQQYFRQLKEGGDEIKQKIAQLQGDVASTRKALEDQTAELDNLRQRNTSLETERDEAITDLNYLHKNQQPAGHRFALEYWANKDGIIHIESKEQVKIPPMMMVIKAGDIPIADPKFGTDGTYAAMIHPVKWRARNSTLFVLENDQLRRVFPCLSGRYTFSLTSAHTKFTTTRKGSENDLNYITLTFNSNE